MTNIEAHKKLKQLEEMHKKLQGCNMNLISTATGIHPHTLRKIRDVPPQDINLWGSTLDKLWHYFEEN